MKATLLKSIAVIILVFSVAFNSTIGAQEKYVSNEDIQNNQVVSKTIYKNEDYFNRHIKYEYKYDNQSRVIQKEVLKWNDRKEEWTKAYKIDLSYSDDQITMEYAKWNKKDKEYNRKKERSIYDLNDNNQPIGCKNFIWNKQESNWKITDDIVYITNTDLLARAE